MTDEQAVDDKPRGAGIVISILFGAIGFMTWIVCMASAPRYSYGAVEDDGNSAFWWILLGVALVGGLLFRRHAALIGFALGLPPLLMSPWTTPRGDNDGLWVLTIPLLAIFLLVLAAVGGVGALLRLAIDRVRRSAALGNST